MPLSLSHSLLFRQLFTVRADSNNGVQPPSCYDFDLFTIEAGSGGFCASRVATNFSASVAICELPFSTIYSETTGGVRGTLENVNIRCFYSKVKIMGTPVFVAGVLTMTLMHTSNSVQQDQGFNFDKQKMIGCSYLIASVFVLSTNVVLQKCLKKKISGTKKTSFHSKIYKIAACR